MASAKHINGVCHNIAHHAVSGLSFIIRMCSLRVAPLALTT
jgi:hypothetical protein